MQRLLIFAKEPRPGAVKTRLAARIGASAACRLYAAFLSDIAAMVRTLGNVSAEWRVDGDPAALRDLAAGAALLPQKGSHLGERLSDAFEGAFCAGFGPVAVIGTDCPLMGPEHLQELYSQVQAEPDACLIPAEDGGYVALGLARPCPEAFARIPWSTGSVLDATVAALTGAGRVVKRLSPLYDVDNFTDIERLYQDLRSDPARAPATAALLRELWRTIGSP